MEVAPADVLTGRMLDRRYHIRSRIAHGGMATVYLATDARLDRQVALKVMHAELARDADFVARFIGEAKSVARLSHPNIVAVFDQGADGSYLYLAMEYVPGRTLRALLRERGWLPWNEALEVIDPILAGLAAAHQAGIAHRDVKPENVLLTADGRVKVVDFGLARATAAMGNTRAGMIIGSVAYIAPEQVTGAVTDARTDVYAAGIMLFELLTGHQPFTGESPLAVAYAHVNADVPAPSDWVAGIPPAVDQLVRATTSRDPQRRPADAGAFLRAVRALRGIPEPGDSVTGAYGPAGAGAGATGAWAQADGNPYPGAGLPAGSHTMVAGGGYGVGATGFGGAAYASPGYGGPGGYDGPGGYGAGDHETDSRGHEPLLQRWLFSRRLAFLAAGTAALLLLGGGGWWLASGRYTTLPAVAGMPAPQARQALTQAGFTVHDGTAVIDDNVPKGDVVGTSPAGRALPGATIVLTVSLGPKMITVPPVAGKSVADATAALKAAGLTVSSATRQVGVPAPFDPASLGSVAGSTPAQGTSWPENKPVYLNVVAGLALPNLVGQDIGAMQGWAGQNHITLQPTQVDSSQPAGIIVSQSPAPATPVQPGATISVSVSNGPPMVQIPDVRGQDCGQAQQQLQQAGFQVTVQQGIFGNKAWFTSPSGQAPAGSTITLSCGGF